MERAPETTSKGSDPVKVFAVLAVILVAVGVVFWLTRPDSAALPGPLEAQPLPETDFSLTDAEAIARFQELDRMRQRAYLERDSSLALSIYSDDSPALERVLKDLATLRKDGVLSRSTFRTKRLSLISNTSERVALRQVVIVSPRFVTESGSRVPGSDVSQRLTIAWTLDFENSEWVLHDSVITASKEL